MEKTFGCAALSAEADTAVKTHHRLTNATLDTDALNILNANDFAEKILFSANGGWNAEVHLQLFLTWDVSNVAQPLVMVVKQTLSWQPQDEAIPRPSAPRLSDGAAGRDSPTGLDQGYEGPICVRVCGPQRVQSDAVS